MINLNGNYFESVMSDGDICINGNLYRRIVGQVHAL